MFGPLKSRGFTKSGTTFSRTRGPLYDVINFQGDRWNGVTAWHGFFVNVGVGSADVDAVRPRPVTDRRSVHNHQERWTIFNRQISEVTGVWAAVLAEQGLLDPMKE